MARFILIEPSHNGNVGAAARAMKTMGFDELWLVAPRDFKVLNRDETIQRASGATDVLSKTQIVQTLDDALHGVHHLCATAMTARDFGPATYTPRDYFEMLFKSERFAQNPLGLDVEMAQEPQLKIAFLFGTERFGMRNEDVYRCNAALRIPTNPQYGSLNLASAVQLIAYDWRQTLGWASCGGFGSSQTREHAQAQPERRLADAAAVSGALAHWSEALVHLNFLDLHAPKKLMPRLNDLFNRAGLHEEEIHILRGIAKAMLEATPAHSPAKNAGQTAG